MARRLSVERQVSRLAVWARRLAFFALIVALLSIVILRSDLLEIEPALVTFGGALVLSMIAMLLALASFVVIWREGVGGLSYSLTAIAIGLALNAYPLYLGTKWYQLPAIADVTTDPIDPPRFDAIARLRTRSSNPAAYAGLYAAELQRAAYPDIEPLLVDAAPNVAYDAARAIIEKRRWRILDAREPIANRREGKIEAVARTMVMGIREDIVVRVRADGTGSRIDIRSASRYGRADFGGNASRIRKLVEDIETLAELPAKKPPPPPKPPAKAQPPAKR